MILNTRNEFSRMRSRGVVAILLVATLAPVGAQQRARTVSPSAAMPGAQELASAWAAVAAGRPADAELIADRLLKAGTRRHEAVGLKIFARVQTGHAEAALDQYEEWVKAAPQEDVFLLQPVAASILETEAAGKDIALRVEALRTLAEAGEQTAVTRLAAEAASGNAPGVADEALARIGNARAVERLTRRVAAANGQADVSSAIDALVTANSENALSAVVSALGPSRSTPTRMAAARALGGVTNAEAVPALRRALADPDPSVRMMAAVSLARLGDSSGAELLQQMEASPVTDIRLLALGASAAGNPSGPWVAIATTALQDPDPAVRLKAAQLLVAHGPDPAAGLAVLNSNLSDPNPALRLMAAGALEVLPREALAGDLASLRRLLRDADPRVRINAAGALLRIAGGVA